MNRRIVSIGFSIVMGASVSLAQAADSTAKDEPLEEIVVTGVLVDTKLQNAPIAITAVNEEQMQKLAPISAADLLKNVPGVFVNSSLGEIRNVVYSRGVSANSLDGASGYFFVSLQEDGLPVSNVTYTNYGPDYFSRPDIMTTRVEALRGGTASLTGPNAPGGIFNYISRNGRDNPGSEVRAKYGEEGNLKNPFYRVDFYNGGMMGSDWSYAVGGFYRKATGARDPGYDLNKGGQLRMNIERQYDTGSVQIYAKYLDDHNGWFEFLPAKNYNDPKVVAGIGDSWSFLPPAAPHGFTNNNGASYDTWNGSRLVHSVGIAAGVKWDQKFGDGWSLTNNLKVSQNKADWNTGAVIFPVALDDFFNYILLGTFGPGGAGTYTFKDHATGQTLAQVMSFSGFDHTVTVNNLPNQQVLTNGVLTQAALDSHKTVKEVMDQFSITHKTDSQALTLGAFFARSDQKDTGGGSGLGLSPIANRPQLLDITLTTFGGQVLKVSNPQGFTGLDSVAFGGTSHTVQTQASAFVGDTWTFAPNWNLDIGGRYERLQVTGENSGPAVSKATAGGLDGDPTTLYDNNPSVPGSLINYSKSLNFFNYTAALSHKFSDRTFLFARYSDGKKAPDLGFYQGLNTQTLVNLSVPQAERVQQLEAGFRNGGDHYSISVSPFYSKLSHVPQSAIFFDLSGTAYTEPTLYNGINTLGVEFEGSVHPVHWFNVHTAITLQDPQSKDFSFWVQAAAQSAATDSVVSIADGQAENNPKILANTTLSVSPTNDLSVDLVWRYTGARAANRNVAFYLPAFSQFDMSISYAATKQLSLSLNVNNLLNDKGVMSWAKAGSFLAALDRQSLTQAQVASNPNDTFSVVTIQPRAAFLTVDYKFN